MIPLKKLYREYYKPTPQGFRKLWKTGVFIFDSCVLLSLYEYSEETSNNLLKILDLLKERIWLPHQVGLEFLRERPGIIFREKNAYNHTIAVLTNALDKFKEVYNLKGFQPTHRILDYQGILDEATEQITMIQKNLKKLEKKHPNWTKRDKILIYLTKLFTKNRHGLPYKRDELQKIKDEADLRYKNYCPPGFDDVKKDKDDKTGQKKYGDFIIWKQILDYAKKTRSSIIFVTGDIKEGWWKMKDDGKSDSKVVFGPREELIREIYDYAGVNFYIYQPTEFIDLAKRYLGISVSPKTIKEVKIIKELRYEIAPRVDSGSEVVGLSASTSPSANPEIQGVINASVSPSIKTKGKKPTAVED